MPGGSQVVYDLSVIERVQLINCLELEDQPTADEKIESAIPHRVLLVEQVEGNLTLEGDLALAWFER